jgi:hypothetical protein
MRFPSQHGHCGDRICEPLSIGNKEMAVHEDTGAGLWRSTGDWCPPSKMFTIRLRLG